MATIYPKKTREQLVSLFKERLAIEDGWAVRGVLRIYEMQEGLERTTRATLIRNGVGFTGYDATILSSIAEQAHKHGSLTRPQINVLHKLMPKYAKQLLAVSSKDKVNRLLDKQPSSLAGLI